MPYSLGRAFACSFKTVKNNFFKLLIIYGVFIGVLSLPVFKYLPECLELAGSSMGDVQAVAFYMFFYVLTAIIGPLKKIIFIVTVMVIFLSPIAKGMAGYITAADEEGKSFSLKEAFLLAKKNYFKFLGAYAVYYGALLAFIGTAFLTLNNILNSSHIIIEDWFIPAVCLFAAGGAVFMFLICFTPCFIVYGKKGGVFALTSSVRYAAKGGFFVNLGYSAVAAALSGGLIAAVAYAAARLTAGGGAYLTMFMSALSEDMKLIIIFLVLLVFAEMFLLTFTFKVFANATFCYKGRFARLKEFKKEKPYRRRLVVREEKPAAAESGQRVPNHTRRKIG